MSTSAVSSPPPSGADPGRPCARCFRLYELVYVLITLIVRALFLGVLHHLWLVHALHLLYYRVT